MFSIMVGLGSIAGLFCLLVFRNGDRCVDQRLCHACHKAGPITLRHYEAIDCGRAIEVAAMAREVWQQLESQFPGQNEEFVLFVIFDRERGSDHHRSGKVVINLAKQDDEDDLLDTMAEEIFHLREWRAGVEREYVFKPEKFLEHEDVVRYYAENPHEHRALQFAVAFVGKRAKLLEEVEEYRRNLSIGSLVPTLSA